MKMSLNTKNKVERIRKIAEKHDWTMTVEDETEDYIIYDFQWYSPAGQDFHFTAELEKGEQATLLYNIYEYYSNFDASYEAYIWLDDSGHGTNGAPYEMGAVYDDMIACEDAVYELYQALLCE